MSTDNKNQEFSGTTVGKFLTEKYPDVANKALDLADEYGVPGADQLKVIFSNTPGIPQEDRLAFTQAMGSYKVEVEKIMAADRQSARNREVEIAKTNSSWLVKNVVPLLAIAWTVFTFVLFILALNGNLDAKENMQFLVINSATNVVMLVVGYYFGSSSGSSAKQQQISDMMKKK